MSLHSFYIYLTIATVLFLLPQQQRKMFPLRFILTFFVGMFCFTFVRTGISNAQFNNLTSFSLALAFMTLLAVFCYQITWSEAVFCAVGGYSIQFIQSTFGEMLHRTIPGGSALIEPLRFVSAVLVLPLCFFLFCRKLKKGQNVDLHKTSLLILLVAAILIEIILCFNLRQAWKVSCDPMFIISDCLLLMICSFCLLTLQFTLLLKKNLEDELEIQQQLLRKERSQYQLSRETIDTINRKCHDMRHQIHTIGRSARIDPTALKEMEGAIQIYDSLYQTGNKALDIILAEKILLCQNNSIEIHCMADGEKIGFMSDTDIYSLFGNLLDNAIHAVQPLDPELRTISLSVVCHGDMISINSHNRHSGEITFEEGIPVTASTDTMNRGFGVKSIVMIVDKYGGTVSFQAKDGMFNLNILFPLNSEP